MEQIQKSISDIKELLDGEFKIWSITNGKTIDHIINMTGSMQKLYYLSIEPNMELWMMQYCLAQDFKDKKKIKRQLRCCFRSCEGHDVRVNYAKALKCLNVLFSYVG